MSQGDKQLVLNLSLAAPFPVLGLTDPTALKDCAIFLMNTKNQ